MTEFMVLIFNPQNPQDFNGKWVAFGGSSEPVEIRINLGSSKAVGEIQFNFWLKYDDDHFIVPPNKIEIFCDGELSSTTKLSI